MNARARTAAALAAGALLAMSVTACGGDDDGAGVADPGGPAPAVTPPGNGSGTGRALAPGGRVGASAAELKPFRDCVQRAGPGSAPGGKPSQATLDARARCSEQLPPAAKRQFDASREHFQQRQELTDQLRECRAQRSGTVEAGGNGCREILKKLEQLRPGPPRAG